MRGRGIGTSAMSLDSRNNQRRQCQISGYR